MEGLNRFDVIEHRGVAMVVIESDLLPSDASVVVIPLLSEYPAVRHLNREISHYRQTWILATRLIGPIKRSNARRIGSVSDQGEKITRAVDVLMGGI